jgi:hypothetical protein
MRLEMTSTIPALINIPPFEPRREPRPKKGGNCPTSRSSGP